MKRGYHFFESSLLFWKARKFSRSLSLESVMLEMFAFAFRWEVSGLDSGLDGNLLESPFETRRMSWREF